MGAIIRAALNSSKWVQPTTHRYRVCEIGEPISDICDPSGEQVREQSVAFMVVLIAQIAALVVSKMILKCKLQKFLRDAKESSQEYRLRTKDLRGFQHLEGIVTQDTSHAVGPSRKRTLRQTVKAV